MEGQKTNSWRDYVRSEAPDSMLKVLSDAVYNHTNRVRKGVESVRQEQDEEKRKKYERVVSRLKRERDFLVMMLRFRDEELPTMLGRTEKALAQGNETEQQIFAEILNFVSGDIYRNKEDPERNEWFTSMNQACKYFEADPKYRGMIDDIDKYCPGYDFGDVPMFYHDICITLNKVMEVYMMMSMYIFKNS